MPLRCNHVCAASHAGSNGAGDTYNENEGVEEIMPLQGQNPAKEPPKACKDFAAARSGGSHKRKAEGKLNDHRAANVEEANTFLEELRIVGGQLDHFRH